MRKGGFGWGREGEPDWEVRLSQSSAGAEEEDDKKGRKMEWAGDSNSNSVNDKKIPMRYFRPFFRFPSVEFNLILIGGADRVGRTTEGESSEKTDAVQQ